MNCRLFYVSKLNGLTEYVYFVSYFKEKTDEGSLIVDTAMFYDSQLSLYIS